MSRRAERAAVAEDAPDSDEIVGDGVSRVGAGGGAELLTRVWVEFVSTCAYVILLFPCLVPPSGHFLWGVWG